jgi:hypothetical protein
MLAAITLKPLGPHHCFMCSGSVKQANTSSRGAFSKREMTNSFSAADAGLAAGAVMASLSSCTFS